jgi:hypothetical protein
MVAFTGHSMLLRSSTAPVRLPSLGTSPWSSPPDRSSLLDGCGGGASYYSVAHGRIGYAHGFVNFLSGLG